MSEKKKKGGCFKILIKGIGLLLGLVVVFAIALTVALMHTEPESVYTENQIDKKISNITEVDEIKELVNVPLYQKIKDQLHLDVGAKTSLFGNEKKWKQLRNVDVYDESKVASVSFDSDEAELLIFEDVSKVIEAVLKFEEINTVKIQVFSQYIDDNGNIQSLPFLNVNLNRDAVDQVNWKNLRSYGKVESFLRQKSEFTKRRER